MKSKRIAFSLLMVNEFIYEENIASRAEVIQVFQELERFYFHSSQASESPYLRRFRKWKIYLSRGRVSQPVDEEIGRLVLFKAPLVFQHDQVASIVK